MEIKKILHQIVIKIVEFKIMQNAYISYVQLKTTSILLHFNACTLKSFEQNYDIVAVKFFVAAVAHLLTSSFLIPNNSYISFLCDKILIIIKI